MHNAVLEANFSENQTAGTDVGNASVVRYTATGGERTFQDDKLIGAKILLVLRDGIEWEAIAPGDAFGSGRTCSVDTGTGDVEYNAALPAMEEGEKATVLYLPGGGEADITEPISLQAAKDWLKVEGDDDDALIEDLIPAARLMCEQYCNKSLVVRTITAVIRNELGEQRLPYGPHGEIVSAVDGDGNAVTLTTRGDQFLTVKDPCYDYLKIVYTAGYSICPPLFKKAILRQVAFLYQNRGNEQSSEQLGANAKQLLKPVRDII